MATPHYESEYGDSYWESVAAEFGNEFVMLLKQAAAIPPSLQQQVLTAAQQAKTQRKQLLARLKQEAAALETANAELQTVAEELTALRTRPLYDCTPAELCHLCEDIDDLHAQCEDVAVRRQSGDLTVQPLGASLDGNRQLTGYFYEELPTTHPVLYAVATISQELTSMQDTITTIRDQ
ncbi:hypothetical protein [Halobacterium sp. CBA1126]|nr:hypothetical protein [Halobacterium sp. CBA1126]MUV59471.1 hypothetical protein [Halobacterium sp. CBA1126]